MKRINREDLLRSKEYWMIQIQNDLFGAIEKYINTKRINKTKLAKELGVSKGYISQVLNGNFDHKLSKLVELALACDAIPLVYFVDQDRFIKDDANDKYYELVPMIRPKAMTFNEPVQILKEDYQPVFSPTEIFSEEPKPTKEKFEEVA